MNGKRIGKRIMWIFGGVIFGAGIALVFGFIVRALWNWLMPSIFGLGEITYWQAWGLVLLSHILFKGSRDSNHGHSNHHGGWENGFKDRMKQRFGGKRSREEWRHKRGDGEDDTMRDTNHDATHDASYDAHRDEGADEGADTPDNEEEENPGESV
jgi:hypothetical protein